MDIVIKNVTGRPDNEGMILELSRAGCPAGTGPRHGHCLQKTKKRCL
jgi:hypothetical protein